MLRLHPGLLLGLCLSLTTFAAEPWDQPFSAAPQAVLDAANKLPAPVVGEDDDPPGIDMLLAEDRYVFDAEGRLTNSTRWVYRVLTENGAKQWETMEASWDAWHQARPELRVRVITASGAVHTLDPSTFKEEGAKDDTDGVFTDTRVLRGPLPAIAPGAVVEQEVVLRDTAPLFRSGAAIRHYLTASFPIRRTIVEVTAPSSAPLKVKAENVSAKPKETRTGGLRTVRYEVADLAKPEDLEPYSPPEQMPYPVISFSTGSGWKEAAAEYAKLVEAQLSGEDLQALARRAFGDARKLPPRELVQKALEWIHAETRYASVAFGDAAIVPRSPSEVLTRKYGDCKDLATLMVALLRARGVPAQVALVRTRWRDVDETLPGMGLFDHAIVHVASSPPLWVDPTSKVMRAGELPVSDQGRLALIASPKTTRLVRTPEARPEENTGAYERVVRVAEDGPATITESRTVTGSLAEDYRSSHEPGDEKQAREFYEGYFKRMFGTKKLASYEAAERPGEGFRVTVSAQGAESLSASEGEVVIPLDINILMGAVPAGLEPPDEDEDGDDEKKRKPRKTALVVNDPQLTTLRFRIHPPEGFVVRAKPEDAVIPLGPESLTRKVTVEKDRSVVVDYKLTVRKRRYTAEEVERFHADHKAWGETDKDQVALEHEGNAHLAAGRTREALAAYRAAVERHPKEALHHLQLADALLAMGLGEPAREEARRATALEPDNARAHQSLGWILQHDLVGRRFEAGFDLPGAIAAYERAKALDATFEVMGDLAILYEHNARGERYGEGAKLDQAIAEYRALAAKFPDRTELARNILYALLRAGRYDELAKEAAAAKKEGDRDVLRVVAATGARGAAAGQAEAARLSNTAEGRRQLLAGAAGQLLLCREYAAAAALLKAASAGAPNAAELASRLRLFEKLKKHETVNLTGDDAMQTVRRMLVTYLSPEVKEEAVRDFLSKRLRASQKSFIEGVQAVVGAERRVLTQAGMRFEHLADFMLAGSDFSATGEANTGTVVRQETSWAASSSASYFLIREDKQWRLAGHSAVPASLAIEALPTAQKGSFAAAERQLDWIRENVSCDRGSSPLSAFCALWPAKPAKRTLEDAKKAAAAAMLASEAPADAVPLAEAMRKTAAPDLARKLDLALAAAYRELKRDDDFDAASQRAYEADPSDEGGLFLRVYALESLKRAAKLRALAEARLAANPDDTLALIALMSAHLDSGDYERGVQVGERLAASGKANADTYNELAWAALFFPTLDERAVDYAHRAVDLTQKKQYAYLHTLATVFAERGDTAEAMETLKAAIAATPKNELRPVDWYVVARICEHHGLVAAARAAYDRALAGQKDPEPFSTELLAQRRRAKLPGEAMVTPAPP